MSNISLELGVDSGELKPFITCPNYVSIAKEGGKFLVVDLLTPFPPPSLQNCLKVRQSGDFPTTLGGGGGQ